MDEYKEEREAWKWIIKSERKTYEFLLRVLKILGISGVISFLVLMVIKLFNILPNLSYLSVFVPLIVYVLIFVWYQLIFFVRYERSRDKKGTFIRVRKHPEISWVKVKR